MAKSNLLAIPPEGFDVAEQLPLMMCFHGGSGTAEGQLSTRAICETRPTKTAFLVYPQALPDPNDGGSTNWQVVTSGELPFTEPNPHSDIDFVSNLIDAMQLLHNVDPLESMPWVLQRRGIRVRPRLPVERQGDGRRGCGAPCTPNRTRTDVNHPTPIVTILGTNDFISSYDGITVCGHLVLPTAATQATTCGST